jgi:epoxyqueuosine reductase QueG
VSGVDLSDAEPGLLAWLDQGFHGDMAYMARHGLRRARPAELLPGTVSVLTVRMDYLPRDTPPDWVERETGRLQQPGQAVVSVYARGRDYHKVLRQRLQRLSDRIAQAVAPLQARVFCDSAPVLEAELAARSGLGWRGKPRGRLCVLLGRDLPEFGLARDRTDQRALRPVQRVHHGLPHGGHRGAAPLGRAALHFLPDH